jgi:hypothetical protein
MRQSFGVGQIVDGDKFNIFAFKTGAIYQTADSSKTVDGYFYWHDYLRSLIDY